MSHPLSSDLFAVAPPIPHSLIDEDKQPAQFRDYAAEARACVRELYRQHHTQQTLDFVLAKKAEYTPLRKAEMSVWEAMEQLDQVVDDSDPDLALPQIVHALQTAEAIRRDGHPRWFILTGLIHDLGKVLCLFGEPQWAVVGDTNPVGCAFSDRIVYSEFFADNPDSRNPLLSTPCGIYEPGCGLDQVHFTWGHDEYLYHVVRNYLPQEALWMIRYHSAYVVHRENEYTHLMNEQDREMLKWVRAFNPYDLYTKSVVQPNVEELRPFYQELVAEFFPPKIAW
ncbi:MAG TPA: inositol oxygenase family protein [Blastocatellia bacterium]|nr:inositol oxygenase family protein [Blastocatellia bacterium]